LDEGEIGDDLDVVAEIVPAALVGRVPADAELVAVDRRLEGDADPLATERVTPLIVSSPRSRSLVRKVISGKRRLSKKSGVWRWPFSCSSLTSTLATVAAPVRMPSATAPPNSRKPPLNVLVPA